VLAPTSVDASLLDALVRLYRRPFNYFTGLQAAPILIGHCRFLSGNLHVVSAEELWEHRYLLLHMSNPDSRKVVAEKTKRLEP